MFVSKITFLLANIGLITSLSSTHHNINASTDKILNDLRNYLVDKRLEKTLLPDFGIPAVPVFIGVILSNLSTVYRTGDSEIWTNNAFLNVKMNIGLEDVKVHIGLCPATLGPLILNITGAKAEIGLTLHPDNITSCTASWDYIKLKTFGEIILQSPNKLYDKKHLPKDLVRYMIQYYNKYLNLNSVIVNIHLVSKYVEMCKFQNLVTTYNKYKP